MNKICLYFSKTRINKCQTFIKTLVVCFFTLLILGLATSSSFAQQEAYKGPHNIPGTIEAENFDTGGEGVAYHDKDPGQAGAVSAYRTATDPDVEVEAKTDASNGHIIGWTADKEWLEYTFNVAEEDDYKVSIMATSSNTAKLKGFQLFIDDVEVSPKINVTSSGWFTEWSDKYSAETKIAVGEHVLKIEIFSAENFAINLDYIHFISTSVADQEPLTVANLINNNAVLQRNENVTMWGTGEPGNSVTITPEWGNAQTTSVGADGNWKSQVPTTGAGGPYSLTISDPTKTFKYTGILLGEVWLCSGQSNMNMPLKGWAEQQINNATQEIANANYPNIHMHTVGRKASWDPESNATGSWKVCTPANAPNFSAVAYFFGRELRTELNVPVGLIVSSKGNSAAEAWTELNYLPPVEGLENAVSEIASSKAGNGPWKIDHIGDDSQLFKTPATLYNGMISPVTPYTIKGVTWYQGESNVDSPKQYQTLLPALVDSWRNAFNDADLPFYIVQICPLASHNNKPGRNSAELREAQFFTKSIANTGVAVALDLGDQWGIHPGNKQDVGKRLALWALAKDYEFDIEYSGPIYTSSEFIGDKGYLKFDNVGDGLKITSGENLFEIAGIDGVFHPAKVAIEGDSLKIWASAVTMPIQARYAWSNWMVPTFYNVHDLPSSSFTTYNAFVFSEAYTIDQSALLITVPESSEPITVESFAAKLNTVIDAKLKVVDKSGKEVSGNLSGNYQVVASMDNGQDTRIYDVDLEGTQALLTTEDSDLISYYPNPINDQLILLNSPIGADIKIISLAGELLLQNTGDSKLLKLDTSSLKNGMYLLTIDNRSVHKIIKQ